MLRLLSSKTLPRFSCLPARRSSYNLNAWTTPLPLGNYTIAGCKQDISFIESNSKQHFVSSLKGMRLRLVDTESDMYRYTEKDIQESPLNGFPPFWAFLWPGGYGLTRYLQENDFLFKDQRATVFDFGCGCGSASIAARQAGAAAVIANDIDPLSVLATAMNCEDNKELKPRHAPLIYGTTHDWLSVSAGELFSYVARCEANAATSQNTADLISSTPKRVLLVGDMLYDYEIGPRVLNLVNDVVGEGWDVYIGDPGRDFANRHLDKVANSEVVAEYELPSEIRSQNNGLLSVRVRSISRR